jgi:hypothetical protein
MSSANLQLSRRTEFNIRPAFDPAVGDINQITAAVFGLIIKDFFPELFQLDRFV